MHGVGGGGGREVDGRLPWDPEMPFAQFEKALDLWMASIPRYMQLHPGTLDSHIAAGQGNLFALMHLLYYHARGYLNREYFPFLSPPNWDPVDGPCDGPLYETGFEPSPFWLQTAHEGVTSARRISTFFNEIIERNLAPWAYPFSGICIMTACTFHVALSICNWNSLSAFMGVPAKTMLAGDILNMIKLQETWPLAAHWVNNP